MPITTPDTEVFYPASDGEPMAETSIHVLAIMLLYQGLEDFLQDVREVFIAADMFWYWEEGNPAAHCAPDVMVVKGVPRGHRRSFFTWREGRAIPCTVFEVVSEKTWRENVNEKRRLYEARGVMEYFLFDPEVAYLQPGLQGFRLDENGVYVSLEPDSEGRLISQALGLSLEIEGQMLRLTDVKSGQRVLTRAEKVQAASEQAEFQREQADFQRQQADLQRQQADLQRQQAQKERERADKLEAEVSRMRALVEQLKNDSGSGPATSAT